MGACLDWGCGIGGVTSCCVSDVGVLIGLAGAGESNRDLCFRGEGVRGCGAGVPRPRELRGGGGGRLGVMGMSPLPLPGVAGATGSGSMACCALLNSGITAASLCVLLGMTTSHVGGTRWLAA